MSDSSSNPPKQRGVILSLLQGGPLVRYDTIATNQEEESISRPHYDKDELHRAVQLCERRVRRKRHAHKKLGTTDEEAGGPSHPTITTCTTSVVPSPTCDLLLLCFMDVTNRHCLKSMDLVADLVFQNNTMECICIPNQESDNETLQVLLQSSGFFSLPMDHPNRSAILQLLCVSRVPTVVVMDLRTSNKIVTTHGLEAMEANSHTCVEEWKQGRSGISFYQSCPLS
eukprot:CAMPEP_0198285094 /NCGR_PEP_ID=MMETSP1449-20131203/4410_1 /TAXON_ID=420275 /ORGANISM="Attheya septentrionalis, Strain CCMP2084" /LENGTH=226 /DNA_ID=CAMNT_0043982355 /DNA_START=282 /DNA_END=962 /DNA_ORIENTATION=+